VNHYDGQSSQKKTDYNLNDIFDILSFFFAFSHITPLHDWVTARDLFMYNNQDLPPIMSTSSTCPVTHDGAPRVTKQERADQLKD
jgi:hypothetical protein